MYNLKNLKIEDIELGIEAKDWIEAIKNASKKLIERKVFGEEYVDAMINSVLQFGPYIVLAENVALAHARPEDGVLETNLYFTTLKNPVDFGDLDNDPVKLLIVLSAKDSDSHLELLTQLSLILGSRETVLKLIDSKTQEEFRSIVLEAINEVQ